MNCEYLIVNCEVQVPTSQFKAVLSTAIHNSLFIMGHVGHIAFIYLFSIART